jgi:hypothetical protein
LKVAARSARKSLFPRLRVTRKLRKDRDFEFVEGQRRGVVPWKFTVASQVFMQGRDKLVEEHLVTSQFSSGGTDGQNCLRRIHEFS